MTFRSLSLRTKIILSFLIVIVFGGLLSLVFGSRIVKNTVISQAQAKVKHDLASAWMVFDEKLNDIKEIVSLTAAREGIHDDLKDSRWDILLNKLSRVREEYALDVLTLVDHEGRVLIRTRNPEAIGDDQSEDEIIKRALKGEVVSRPQIVPGEELMKEASELAAQAHIKFVLTPKAAFRPENEETRGMMLKAASPVVDDDNTLIGVLYGGILINRSYEIVDSVKETVYKDEKYKGREIGTVTIFQHDLRISTNVRTERKERAIGTRVSREVSRAVLQEGKPWIDRAFVVNDWYITAYEPIKNVNNDIIGMLYVGMLEKPYNDTTVRVMLTFILMAFLCVVLLLIILYFSTTKIIHPLKKMVIATEEIAKGDLSHKVSVKSKDEIGHLAESFNQMTLKLKAANEELVEWGKTMEEKVNERTTELTKMHAQLVQSEKLASLGKLSASIAHEINNPLGGILIYSHLLLEDTAEDSPNYENLKKIAQETTRCKDIVKGLLEFARPKEPQKSLLEVNEILEKSLSIMENQELFQNIRIKKMFASPLPKIVADSAQLQQVFMNIILNAAEAMNGDGILTLSTSMREEDSSIEIKFSDTGPGIKEEDRKRLFEPFFSTKEGGKGTGLGLAISYSIIQKHHGTIEVNTELGKGSTFVVKLPFSEDGTHE